MAQQPTWLKGEFGIRLHGHEVLAELPSPSARTRSYVVRPHLHDDVPTYMAKEEPCYVLKCVEIASSVEKGRQRLRWSAHIAMALRETHTLLKLRHANLVSYYKSFVHEGRLCTMMSHLETGSLHDLFAGLREGAEWTTPFCAAGEPAVVAPKLAWHLLLQTVEGLHKLHCSSIVHRAIKPSNLLLEPETVFAHPEFKWRLKISDVAVPEVLRSETHMPSPQSVRYMAPELVTGQTPYDERVRAVYLSLYISHTRTRAHTRTHAHTHTHAYARTRARARARTHARARAHSHAYTYTRACAHTYRQTRTHM